MFKNMKISTQLALGFGTVLCSAAVLALCGFVALASVLGGFRVVTTDVWPKIDLANQSMQQAYEYTRSFSFIIISAGKPGVSAEALQKAQDVLTDTAKGVTENVALLKKMPLSDQETALLDKVNATRLAYVNNRAKVLDFKKSGENDKAVDLMFSETLDLQSAYMNSWKDFVKYEAGLLNQGAATAEGTYHFAITLMIVIFAAALIGGLSIAYRITRGVRRSLGGELGYAATIVDHIAAGDLTVEVKTEARDQSSLLFGMKTMRDRLANIVSQVRTGTDTIANASGEIAAGNMDLSSRTETQASSLEETAATMEELTSTVKENAANAHQANQLAQTASEMAEKGGAVVSQVVETMGAINESSRKIVDIIAVIDGIAFQTNILALNAAVEAARAGEQGRGFAVVATEVRNLAQRSAVAAKEIKTLIGDSVEKVETGSKLVDQAGSTMHEVVTSIRHVNGIMSKITAASQEQTTGIEQISQAIVNMDHVTQQNTALVEEAAAASDALQHQASHLAQVVSVFKLDGMQTAALLP